MRKTNLIVAILVIFVIALTGCGVAKGPAGPAEVDISQFPDAYEYDVYEWPKFGITEKIPTPMWSNRGEIYWDSGDSFCCEVGYSTQENYGSYVKACQDAGYTENYYSIPGGLYYATNSEGNAVLLIYDDYSYSLQIQTTSNPETWNRPWID